MKQKIIGRNHCFWPQLSWVALSVLVLILWGPSSAQAEPYLAIQEGYKCSICHVNMTGGGKRTDFANIYVQTRLANNFFDWRRYKIDADEEIDEEENPLKTDASSSFFSGRLNDYIAIGGDFRATLERTEETGSPSKDEFKRRKQNIYLEVDLIPDRVLFYQTIAGDDAKEVFGLFRGEFKQEPYYFKVGEFFLPYGLRLQDDSAFTRNVMGFTYFKTEVGVEFGYEPGPWALHAALTNGSDGGNFDNNGGKQLTASAAYVDKGYRVGGSYDTNKNAQGIETIKWGINGGAQFGRVGILAEIDFKDNSTVEQQIVLAELNFLVSRGNNVKFSYEYHDPDEAIFQNAKERYSVVYEPFLNQFLQLRAGLRKNNGIPQSTSMNTTFSFIELHLFF